MSKGVLSWGFHPASCDKGGYAYDPGGFSGVGSYVRRVRIRKDSVRHYKTENNRHMQDGTKDDSVIL